MSYVAMAAKQASACVREWACVLRKKECIKKFFLVTSIPHVTMVTENGNRFCSHGNCLIDILVTTLVLKTSRYVFTRIREVDLHYLYLYTCVPVGEA